MRQPENAEEHESKVRDEESAFLLPNINASVLSEDAKKKKMDGSVLRRRECRSNGRRALKLDRRCELKCVWEMRMLIVPWSKDQLNKEAAGDDTIARIRGRVHMSMLHRQGRMRSS